MATDRQRNCSLDVTDTNDASSLSTTDTQGNWGGPQPPSPLKVTDVITAYNSFWQQTDSKTRTCVMAHPSGNRQTRRGLVALLQQSLLTWEISLARNLSIPIPRKERDTANNGQTYTAPVHLVPATFTRGSRQRALSNVPVLHCWEGVNKGQTSRSLAEPQ